MTTRFYSVDPNSINQSTETWYLSADEARQADLAAKFLDHPSHVIMPENSDATEQARKSSEQLAQVTQTSPKPRWIIPNIISYTPAEYAGPALVAGCAGTKIGDAMDGNLSVGCEDSTFDNIGDAINYASNGDIIEVCSGTYEGFYVNNKFLTIKAKDGHSPKIDLSTFGYDVMIDNYLDLPGYKFVLSGFEIYNSNSDAVYISLSNEGENIEIVLSDLIIHNSGTGIRISASNYNSLNLSISNVVVQDNAFTALSISLSDTADSIVNLDNIDSYNNDSSGIEISGEKAFVTVSNLDVHDNGSLFEEGGILILLSEVSISDSTITDNIGYYGGGIYLDGGNLTLENTTIENNVATNPYGIGGGLQLVGTEAISTVTANNTNWDETNTPYDVSVQNPTDSTVNPDYVFKYDTNVSFECEYEVGCTDL